MPEGSGGSGQGGSAQGGGSVVSSSASASGSGGAGAMGGSGGSGGSGGAVGSSGSGSSVGSGGAGGAVGSGGAGGSGGSIGSGGGPPIGTADYPAEVEQNNLKSTANPLAPGTKGFTGRIWPLGDVDVFSVFVTPAGSGLRVELTDGMGGCIAGSAKVSVLSATMTLASDTGACVLLMPPQDPALSNLAEDTYYVQIESATLNPIPLYVVDIQILAAGCGDGQVQTGEQCDDGNTTPGDGCSDMCQLEGNYLNETEPNNTAATRNMLGGADGFVGAISPVGDKDYFSFDVTVPGSSVTIEITDGFGGCPSGFDSKIYLYDANVQEIANDDDGGVGVCSWISPSANPGATNLATGLYTVMVEEFGNNATTPFYVIEIKVNAPGCGDGILQGGEQCDDGNMAPGDGCDPTCQLEGNYLTETEINDTLALANSTTGYDGATGSISPVGDLDYFSFDVTVPGSSVFLEVTDGAGGCPAGFDSVLTFYSPTNQVLESDDDGGVGTCSAITPSLYPAATNLAPGLYKVRIEEYGNNSVAPFYVLKIKVAAPGCGDGLLQAGEQCDDGNTTPGDGCDAACQAEPPWEIEPNGASTQATPLWPGYSYWRGRITPTGDHDYFRFDVPAGGASVTLETHDVGNPATCSFDSVIYLVNQANMPVAESDDEGIDTCSRLSPIDFPVLGNLAAGTYYVWVQRFADTMEIPAYELTLTMQ